MPEFSQPTNHDLEQITQGTMLRSASRGLGPIWIIAYVVLLQLWIQLVIHQHDRLSQMLGRWVVFERNTDTFKVIFLAIVATILVGRRDWASLHRYFIGRWAPPRVDSKRVVLLLLTTGIIVALIEIYSATPVTPISTRAFIENVVWAPLNEELIFRGLFLGILLERKRLPPWTSPCHCEMVLHRPAFPR